MATPECPEAQHLLAVMYGKGEGVKQDVVRAYALLLASFSEGMTPVVGNAVIPVLGKDQNESEIVQFAATLNRQQLWNGEKLAYK